jgi:hypothetical protein
MGLGTAFFSRPLATVNISDRRSAMGFRPLKKLWWTTAETPECSYGLSFCGLSGCRGVKHHEVEDGWDIRAGLRCQDLFAGGKKSRKRHVSEADDVEGTYTGLVRVYIGLRSQEALHARGAIVLDLVMAEERAGGLHFDSPSELAHTPVNLWRMSETQHCPYQHLLGMRAPRYT